MPINRLFKQIIIVLVFLVILILVGFLIYWISRPAPSCFDRIQNQNEEGIDCGGLCPSCELFALEKINVLWVRVFPASSGFYDLAAKIKNPNQNYGSANIPYQLRVYNSNHILISEYDGLTYILPNQTKYLTKLKIQSAEIIDKIELSFGETEWQKFSDDYQLPQLVIQQKEYRLLDSKTGYSQARALLINKTNFDFDKIDIDVLLFGVNNRLIDINSTEMRTLLAGEDRDFVVSWFRAVPEEVNNIEIEAETNVFDSDNYMRIYGKPEKFKQY